jgi:hypothetical protein
MVGTAQTPWFQLFAVIVCAGLVAFAIITSRRIDREAHPVSWWSSVSAAILFLLVGIFFFYLGETAGTADPVPLEPEGMTEINNQAPPALTPTEIAKDSEETTGQVFGETTKTVEDHEAEANKSIDRALERSRKNNTP